MTDISNIDTNFDVEDDAVEEPLIPNGDYQGMVTDVTLDLEGAMIVWDVVITCDPEMLASDLETPINGMTVQYRNFLPKVGDENEMAKNGKVTKKQSKINMLMDFAKKMDIKLGSMKNIQQSIENKAWAGLEVLVKVYAETFEDRTRNKIKTMKRLPF
jgi:hypothetical protein